MENVLICEGIWRFAFAALLGADEMLWMVVKNW